MAASVAEPPSQVKLGIGGKVIVCDAAVTVKVCVTRGAGS